MSITSTLSRCAAVVLLFASLSLAQSGKKSAAETATWKGTLNANGTELRLEIDVTTGGETLVGELRSPDQGNFKLKVTDIKTDGEFSFSVEQIKASFKGKFSSDGKTAEGTFRQSGMELPLKLTKTETKAAAPPRKEKLKEAWVGKLELGVMKPVMQFRVVTRESGETAAYFDSVTEGQTGFESTWSVKDGELRFTVKQIRLTYVGKLDETGETAVGTWTQAGREFPLTLKKQLTEYDNKNTWENRPQRPVGPFPYDAIDVTFENKADDLTLAGTLTIPKKAGRHPVAILISGSGPQDRDESLMEHKPFLVLADYLSRRGIAVLRYDDRGFGKSTGKFAGATTEAFARDASAAVEFLKTHERINPKQIGLAGHSEGGLIAPMVVGMRDDVAFVVLMAATGVDGKTIVFTQSEAMSRAEGIDEAEIEISLKTTKAVILAAMGSKDEKSAAEAAMKALEPIIADLPESEREESGKKIRDSVRGQLPQLTGDWMRFFLAYDPRPALSKITCPTLAIIGTKDTQVLPDLNMPEVQKALLSSGNKDVSIVKIDGLNHLFQKCETGGLSEYATIQETFNPEALKAIGDWIETHTTIIR